MKTNLSTKWRLVRAISRDARLEPVDVKVAFELLEHLSDDRGAYPSQETLARLTGVSARTVRDALKRLATAGYFVAVAYSKGGRGRSTVWRIGTPGAPETRQAASGIAPENAEAQSRLSRPETRKQGGQNPEVCDTKPGSRLPTNPLVRTRLDEPIGERSSATAARARDADRDREARPVPDPRGPAPTPRARASNGQQPSDDAERLPPGSNLVGPTVDGLARGAPTDMRDLPFRAPIRISRQAQQQRQRLIAFVEGRL